MCQNFSVWTSPAAKFVDGCECGGAKLVRGLRLAYVDFLSEKITEASKTTTAPIAREDDLI